jgi:hypothetical protein
VEEGAGVSGPEPDIERNGYRAVAQATEVTDDEREPVAEEDSDPFAAPDLPLLKVAGEAARQSPQLRIAQSGVVTQYSGSRGMVPAVLIEDRHEVHARSTAPS